MNIKRIIAREGLVFIGIVGVGLIIAFSKYDYGGLGTALVYIGYPIYLLIRFIIWAIKTLKEK